VEELEGEGEAGGGSAPDSELGDGSSPPTADCDEITLQTQHTKTLHT